MIIVCEGECQEYIEISDIIDPENNEEFRQALKELADANWGWIAGDEPHDIKIYCPVHKEEASKERERVNKVVEGMEARERNLTVTDTDFKELE